MMKEHDQDLNIDDQLPQEEVEIDAVEEMTEDAGKLPEKVSEETDEATEEEAKSALRELMGKENFSSEDDVAAAYEKLKKEYSRIKRENAQYRSQELLDSEEAPKKSIDDLTVPEDVDEFLKAFAQKPLDVINKLIDRRFRPVEVNMYEQEKESAINYILSSKDYYDGMEDDVLEVLSDNANVLYNVNNQAVPLKNLRPMQKARLAIQLLKQKKEAEKPASTTTTKPKPPSVAQSKKTAKTAKVVDDSKLSSEDFLKKYGLDKKVQAL